MNAATSLIVERAAVALTSSDPTMESGYRAEILRAVAANDIERAGRAFIEWAKVRKS